MIDSFIIEIEKIVKKAFRDLAVNEDYGQVTISNRKELGQFQCNGAFKAAKEVKKSPLEFASEVTNILTSNDQFSEVTVTPPGFINIKLSNIALTEHLTRILNDECIETPLKHNKEKIILDYGGVNIAKAMHVGHLRSSIAGESIKRILKLLGDEVISDIHLGDWGLPMGMLIEELKEIHPEWPYFQNNFLENDSYHPPLTINDLEILYPRAAAKCKVDKDARDRARAATKKLQQEDRGYLALWKRFLEVSITDIKSQFKIIDVDFDLWLGESSVNNLIPTMIKTLSDKKIAKESNNALIIQVEKEDDKSPMPPVILVTSDETITYATTDLATIIDRVKNYQPTKILYVVDKRQSLHFEQVFRAAEISEIIDNRNKLEHLGFGTINGLDNKPFKTRDGSAMRLSELINMVIDKARERITQENIGTELSNDEKETIIHSVAIATIKFADLSTELTADYIFDVDKFTSFQGRTGPYILYSAVRVKSILAKAKDRGLVPDKIILKDEFEVELALKIIQFPNIIKSTYDNRAPHILCDYVYTLAQTFSTFYQNCPILKEENKELAASRLGLATITLRYFEQILYLLGIKIPNRM
ncbi:MAG: arginine--tRNA ligase [Alphaproteobacteria bacterium]